LCYHCEFRQFSLLDTQGACGDARKIAFPATKSKSAVLHQHQTARFNVVLASRACINFCLFSTCLTTFKVANFFTPSRNLNAAYCAKTLKKTKSSATYSTAKV
jgi:hypothetical protein